MAKLIDKDIKKIHSRTVKPTYVAFNYYETYLNVSQDNVTIEAPTPSLELSR